MALRAVKPKSIQKRLKLFLYGNAKVGKTTAAIQFPKPYLIDTERGAENDKYVQMLEKGGGVIFQTNDFEEVVKEVKSLLTEKHEYKTLIIDPLTTLYNDLIDKCATKFGTKFAIHYAEAGKRIKYLYNLLLRLDMNVLITSHSKNEYGQSMEVVGQTFDCYKKLDFMFDLILEIQKRGKKRFAVVKGSRLEGFTEDESFEFSYDDICNRYGKDILEKDCESSVLASKEQIEEIKRLIQVTNSGLEVVSKMLKREEVESFEYMSERYILECIKYFKSKISGETT